MKNVFSLFLKKEAVSIILRSNFDSGNMNKAEFGINGSIIITPANDNAGT
jgi:hypothetical protein